jgi:hypothetical protein
MIMKKQFILFLWFAIPFFCMAQNPLTREYYYDAAGNRILRKVMELPAFTPPPPQDTTNYTQATQLEYSSEEPLTTLTSFETAPSLETTPSLEEPRYFLETLAQTAIKIYPNPTTEKVTMEITGWETLQTGVFKLYSLSGQLLQEQPVHSLNTTISLAGLPKGAYLLKVQINEQTEEWKVIKQ